jgi:protein-S-isoprenylcysteine O-methyltransferase Ste14
LSPGVASSRSNRGSSPHRTLPAGWWGAVSAALTFGQARTLLVRLCGAVWFLLLSAASFNVVSGQIADLAAGRTSFSGTWPALLSQGCIFLFYTIIFCIMILRPEPVSRAAGVGPVLLTLAGCYGPWLIPLLPRGPELPALAVASAAILLVSEALMVCPLLFLGRSFSLMPQARKLVTSGPYAIVRHPLYLVEEAAVVGVLSQYAWFAALPFLALHVSVQIRRMQLEEKVLRKAFPEYAAYARRTPRLIPGVW